jgi:anti-sigma regulatory factor (Ser/Thr protein kinase)
MNRRSVQDDLGDVGAAIEWAGGFVDAAGLSADVRFAVDLSLEEALANLIMHGRSETGDKAIEVAVDADTAGATVTITDRCAPFDVTEVEAETNGAELRIGGRGLTLLRSFAGALNYVASPSGNTLTMTFPA